MKNLFVSMVCLIFFLASCSMGHMTNGSSEGSGQNAQVENPGMIDRSTAGLDYREPSQNPPNGLKPEEVPMFIVLGYDDNQFADGMTNVLNLVRNRKNPAGSGNAATFDGAPMHVSFYNNPAGRNDTEEWSVSDATIATWKESYLLGHEVANHTYYHEHGLAFTKERWKDEMQKCTDFFVQKVGIPASEIIGFRTPFLEYNDNTFYALQDLGMTYECSFEGGRIYWPAQDGSTLMWPYTMDNGTPANESGRPLPKVPGMWQLPNDCIYLPGGGYVTGFDYNLWFQKSMTKNQFVEALKYSLDKKYNGNRAPMNVGLHSNYYSDEAIEEMKIYDPGSVVKLKSTVAERTAALEEFIAYASTLPNVRFVSNKELLQWLKNPVALGGPVKQYTISATSGTNGSLLPEGDTLVTEGGNLTVTAKPDAGFVVDAVSVDGLAAALDANNQYIFTGVKENHTINVTFKAGKTFTITATSGPNGKWDNEGDIVVPEGGSLTLNALADAGYEVDTITVDGTVSTGITSYTFTGTAANHTIDVRFKVLPLPDVKVVYEITQDWGSGFGGKVTVTNNTASAINGWQVVWTYPGAEKVTSLWNASFSQTGNKVTVSNLSWNATIAPGASLSFGFNGVYSGTNEIPTDIKVVY